MPTPYQPPAHSTSQHLLLTLLLGPRIPLHPTHPDGTQLRALMAQEHPKTLL